MGEARWRAEALPHRHGGRGADDLRRLWAAIRALDIESFTIVTTAANYTLRALHDRMPVILHPEDFDRWLDPAAPAADLLRPARDDALRLFRVSPKVNSYKADDPSCIAPLTR